MVPGADTQPDADPARGAPAVSTLHIPLGTTDRRKCKQRWGGAVPRTRARSLLSTRATEHEWLEARRGTEHDWRIGASEFAAVLGSSPHTSAFSLWWAKQGTWARPEANTAMVVGHKLEDVIGGLWADAHPDMMLCRPGSALYGHYAPAHEWLVCTPDFLAVRNLVDSCTHGADCEVHPDSNRQHNFDAVPILTVEPVECKSDDGGKGWGKPGTDEVPFHHRVQVYTQCEILGATRGHLMRLAGKRPAAYVLPYDADARGKMGRWLEEGRDFIQTLYNNDPPDPDGHSATTEALQQIYAGFVDGKEVTLPNELVNDYQFFHDELARIKEQFEEAKNKVRAALGDGQLGVDVAGRKVVKRNIYKKRGYEVGPQQVDELRRMS